MTKKKKKKKKKKKIKIKELFKSNKTTSPAVITVVDVQDNTKVIYTTRTTSLLLYLPTPDFSMPYNVIILTSTVIALAVGNVFNLLTRRFVVVRNKNK